MSFKNRVSKLEGINHRGHKSLEPVCVLWFGDTPDFKNEPKTKVDAIDFIRRRDMRKQGDPKDLLLVPVDSQAPTLRSYLMDKFEITEGEL